MKPVLSVKQLDVSAGTRTLVKNLSFTINPGTLTWVTGENGVGKTTLVRTLLRHFGHHDPVNFGIRFNQVQVVPQFRNVAADFPLTVRDFVGLSANRSWLPWLSSGEKRSLARVLKLTNLTHLTREPLGEASGGEQQRVFLAQALMTAPKLLILDETTASLDTEAKVGFLEVVKRVIKHQNVAVIFITHDPALIHRFGDFELHIERRRGELKSLGGEK